MQTVEQRHRDAALTFFREHQVSWAAHMDAGGTHPLVQAFARFEASLPPSAPVDRDAFQARVAPWMQECFGAEISGDRIERGDRFLEEALELLQSGGYDRERVALLVDYVWGRPAGEPAQEVGGVMVTLAAYCLAFGLDMHEAAETELARILRPEIVAKIRLKQATKATAIGNSSPLPIAALALPPSGIAEMVREMCAAKAEEIAAYTRAAIEENAHYGDAYGDAISEARADASDAIASAIRALDLSNKGAG